MDEQSSNQLKGIMDEQWSNQSELKDEQWSNQLELIMDE